MKPHVSADYAIVRVQTELDKTQHTWGLVLDITKDAALILFFAYEDRVGRRHFTPPEEVSMSAIHSFCGFPPMGEVDRLNKEIEEKRASDDNN